jgi:hypothetical protein
MLPAKLDERAATFGMSAFGMVNVGTTLSA